VNRTAFCAGTFYIYVGEYTKRYFRFRNGEVETYYEKEWVTAPKWFVFSFYKDVNQEEFRRKSSFYVTPDDFSLDLLAATSTL